MLRARSLLSLATILPALACSNNVPLADGGLDAVARADASDVPLATDVPVDVSPQRWTMPPCAQPVAHFAPLGVACQNFVDSAGRVVFLHGINARVDGVFDVTFTDGRVALEALPAFTAVDAQRMRALGFNLLRLPINWSAIEPVDHGAATVDATYLARVHAVVHIAHDAGIYVLLDFHEDAYSKEIGEDGAPLWAIRPPPAMILGGPLGDLGSRRTSGQVLAAFGTFFGDAEPGPTLRSRFASMAAQVAASFRDDTTVMGIEIYNEPIADDSEVTRLNIAVATAIRAADPNHIIAFEPSAARNLLDRSSVSSVRFPVAGAAYAPHIYTVAFSGSESARASFTRSSLRTSHLNAAYERSAWGTPLLVTEWGYGPADTRASEYFALESDLQDEFGESAAFWVWKERSQGSWGLFDYDAATDTWTERAAVRSALARVMPEAVAGWPESFGYDRVARRFELRFAGSDHVTAPNRIYLPIAADFSSSFDVTCDGAPLAPVRDAATGLIDVPCNGVGEHTVTIIAR